jgi:NADH-quinone oxidoreductase subunit A
MPLSVEMIDQFAPILVLIAVVVGFTVVMLGGTFLVGPKRNPEPDKQVSYECGVRPDDQGTTRFSVKFHLAAILFILFDIEVIFLYPWALIYSDFLKQGAFIFYEMVSFMAILTFGLFYVWKARALDWD